MLQSSQNAQEMCRNDFRTSLKKNHDFRNILGPNLRSGSDPGIFELLNQKKCHGRDFYRGYDPVRVGAATFEPTGSISYVLELFSAIFGKSNLCTKFKSRFC